MTQYHIHLDGIAKVKAFHALCLALTFDIAVRTGRYCVDTKSLPGILSLPLNKPARLVAHTADVEMVQTVFAGFILE